METLEIFGLQFVLSMVVVALIAKWYTAPWLRDKPLQAALAILILPHAFRHLGLVFLTPVVVSDTMPPFFAATAGYGDLAAGLLAILALVALRSRWAIAVALVWIFNLVGTIDLLNALRQETAVPHMGSAWYIPTFVVPVLLVTHVMIFARLVKKEQTAKVEAPV